MRLTSDREVAGSKLLNDLEIGSIDPHSAGQRAVGSSRHEKEVDCGIKSEQNILGAGDHNICAGFSFSF